MLKDITLGQYFPGNTVIHRIDPRVKIVVTMAYIVVLFFAKGPLSYGLCLAALIYAIMASKISMKTVLKSMKPLLFIILFTAVLNVFYVQADSYFFEWGFLKISWLGVKTAFYMALRIAMLVSGTFVFLTYTTSPIMLTDGIEHLLNPLKRFKVPVHELAMMMTIALRFIPTLIEETDKIMSAQKARGADFESGNILNRAKALVPILVPLFISAFRRADELAVAMECRCYRGSEGRTRLKELHMQPLDYIACGITAVLFAVVAVCGMAFGI